MPARLGRRRERIRRSPAGPRRSMSPENLWERRPTPAAIARWTGGMAAVPDSGVPRAYCIKGTAAATSGKQQRTGINKAAAPATVARALEAAWAALAAHEDVKWRADSEE